MKKHINLSLLTTFSTTISILAANSAKAFQLRSRWSTTATDGSGLVQGDPTTITWSIAPDSTSIPGFNGEPAASSNLISFLDGIYGSAGTPIIQNKAWFGDINASLNRWSQLTGITYQYEANDDGAAFSNISSVASGVLGTRGDVRLGGHAIDGNFGTLAYNFFPNVGDMVIDTTDSFYNNAASNSLGLRNVLMHEQGHGIGLEHLESSDGNFLLEPFLSTAFDGPQFDDILGAQRLYGDALETKQGGNETIADAHNLGSFNVNDSFSIGTDAVDLVVAAAETDFVSIDGLSDTDFFQINVSSNSVLDIALQVLGDSYNQGPQGGSQSLFNPSTQNDLGLELLASDGITSLGLSNSGGLGASESLSNISLSSGDYFIRVFGTQDAAQFYSLNLNLSPATAVPFEFSPSLSLLILGLWLGSKYLWQKNRRKYDMGVKEY